MRLVLWLCVALLAATATGTGCAPSSPSSTMTGTDLSATKVHLFPRRSTSRAPTTLPPSDAKLVYNSGPVLGHVKVVQVLYGRGTYAPEVEGTQLGQFFRQVTDSPYLDWLSEYDTFQPGVDQKPGTQQHIGRGTFEGQVRIAPSPANSGSNLTDAQVRAELAAQLAAGKLPAPDRDTVYMVNFPSGVTLTSGFMTSCIANGFCAYHSSFSVGGTHVYYGVLPDMAPGSGCATGCGDATRPFDNQTAVASHELTEAITDADVGAADGDYAWYDRNNGEIGDLCSALLGTIVGKDGVTYTVQKEYSNERAACIVSKATSDVTLTLEPANLSLVPGTSGQVTVSASLLSGTPTSVALSLGALPAGVTASLNPLALTVGSASVLTVTAAASAAVTTVPVVVSAADPSGTATAALGLAIRPGGVDVLVNGGFETGDLTGWNPQGAVAVAASPHAGAKAAQLGTAQGTWGDSSVQQTFTAPPGATSLSFWYQVTCNDVVTNDWATATLEDLTAATTQVVLPPACAKGPWTQTSAPVLPGHRYTLTLTNHDDGLALDATSTLFDDVQLR